MNEMRVLAAALAAALLIVSEAAAQAPMFPTRPVTIVLPYPPGGSTDAVARLIQPKLEAALGQSVVIENRGGGAGNVGTLAVSHAAPDGHTILLTANALMTLNPYLVKDMPFDPVKDFAPITTAVNAPLGIAVNPTLGIGTLPELIDYARAHPNQVSFGTARQGSPQHLLGERLNQQAGVTMVHVPYKGGGPAVQDTIAGHIQFTISTLSSVLPQHDSGQLKIIAIGEDKRFEERPEIPTVSETYPGTVVTTWLAFFAPAATPRPIVDRLNAEIVKALNDPQVKPKLTQLALVVVGDKPDELAQRMKDEHAMWGGLVQALHIEPE
jgi:tripartite-type tricarboxylate transporter receptor subunit TctC